MNYELLRDKHLLLDTNIIIDYSKYPTFFSEFIANLKLHNVTLVVDETVRFEFLRHANSPEKRADLEKFFNALLASDLTLTINKDTVTDAIGIANIYAWKSKDKKSVVELADCFLAAAMKKFNGTSAKPRLYLATQNHKHYPDFMFKRVGIETIDIAGDSIINIGIYEFNKDTFENVEKAYLNKGN